MIDDIPWDGYAASLIQIRRGDSVFEVFQDPRLDLADVGDLSLVEGIVLTACNPLSRRLPSAENKLRTCELEEDLSNCGYEYFPAVGFSRDCTWVEASVLVPGMHRKEACSVAKRFGQAAFFELIGQFTFVVDEYGNTVATRRSVISTVSGSFIDTVW